MRSNWFMLIPGAAGYGDRIYVNANNMQACDILKRACKWGNYDKVLQKGKDDDGMLRDDLLYGYEFRNSAEVIPFLRALRMEQLSREEMTRVFSEYSVR